MTISAEEKEQLQQEGYKVLMPQVEDKGVACGLCGMKFERNKPHGYVCRQMRCPVFPQNRWGKA